jgi:hypothetical protein
MISNRERSLVKLVAKLSPWLAPIPSGYFVARSSMEHLNLPVAMGISVGLIIELLGISSVHTWIWLSDWNANKRKSDPTAPTGFVSLMSSVYIVVTIGLTVVLAVIPDLATFAPALFPVLAMIGGINLALIAQQEVREVAVQRERQSKRSSKRNLNSLQSVQNETVNMSIVDKADAGFVSTNGRSSRHKTSTLDTLIRILDTNPEIGVTELARQVNRSRTTVYKYLDELESDGRINRNR